MLVQGSVITHKFVVVCSSSRLFGRYPAWLMQAGFACCTQVAVPEEGEAEGAGARMRHRSRSSGHRL